METNVFMRSGIPVADRPAQYRAVLDDFHQSLDGRQHTIVDFEAAAADADYAYERVGFLLGLDRDEFTDLHTKVTRPDWVGFNARLSP